MRAAPPPTMFRTLEEARAALPLRYRVRHGGAEFEVVGLRPGGSETQARIIEADGRPKWTSARWIDLHAAPVAREAPPAPTQHALL